MALKREQSDLQTGQRQALLRMVHRFATIGRDRAQMAIETGPNGQEALRAILIEIDETMLPRRIRVEGAVGWQMDLYASNRRLLAVKTNDIERETTLNSPHKLAGQFADILRSFITENDEVRILPPQKIAPSKDSGVSVSTDLLAHALGLTDRWNDSDPTDALAALERVSIASLHATPCPSFSREQGTDTDLDQLKAFWCEYTHNVAHRKDAWHGNDGQRDCKAFELDHQRYLIVVHLHHDSTLLALLQREHLSILQKI